MQRLEFLKHMILPAAAGAAAVAARKLDPAGEPISEAAPVIVVNAPNAVLSNMRIDATGSRRTAVQMNPGASHALVQNNIFIRD